MADRSTYQPEHLRLILEHEGWFAGKGRIGSLYSDFRPLRTSNPDGYAANVSAWQKALEYLTREGFIPVPGSGNDLLILHTNEDLPRNLETRVWGRPLALGTVVKEMLEKKQLFELQDFLTRVESVHARPWTLTPWHILAWGLRLLGLQGGVAGEDHLPLGRFVLLENIEEAASKVLYQMSGRDRVDRIFSPTMFKAEFARLFWQRGCPSSTLIPGPILTDADLEVLLKYLARDKQAVAHDGETIKFIQPGDKSTSITSEDAAIASLKTLISQQTARASLLSERMNHLVGKATAARHKGDRVTMLAALRSQKLVEKTRTQCLDNLAQLEAISNSIRQAADQVELVRVMEASTGALRSLREEIGGVDRVEEVMHELGDELSRANEVGTIINEMGPTSAGDEVELDDELQAIEREESERQARARDEELVSRLAAIENIAPAKTPAVQEPLNHEAGQEQHDEPKDVSMEATPGAPIEEKITEDMLPAQ